MNMHDDIDLKYATRVGFTWGIFGGILLGTVLTLVGAEIADYYGLLD